MLWCRIPCIQACHPSEVALRIHFTCCIFLSIELRVQCPAREPPNLHDLSRGKQLSSHRGDCAAINTHHFSSCTIHEFIIWRNTLSPVNLSQSGSDWWAGTWCCNKIHSYQVCSIAADSAPSKGPLGAHPAHEDCASDFPHLLREYAERLDVLLPPLADPFCPELMLLTLLKKQLFTQKSYS